MILVIDYSLYVLVLARSVGNQPTPHPHKNNYFIALTSMVVEKISQSLEVYLLLVKGQL